MAVREGRASTASVAEEIRRRIFTNEYRPGQRLKEMEISEQMGVSRTPVREAFRVLEADGLIVSQPNKGVIVAEPMNEEEIVYSLHLSGILGGEAGYLAAKYITEDQKKQLVAHHEAMKALLEAGDDYDGNLAGRMDDEFHEIIAACSGQQILQDMQRYLLNGQIRGKTKYIFKDRLKVSLMEHESIVQAILAGESENARDYTLIHFRHSEESNRKKIKMFKERRESGRNA